MLTQSSVPAFQSLMWSSALLPALAADEAPPPLDDFGSTFLDGGREIAFDPSVVADCLEQIAALESGAVQLRLHGGTVVAEDAEVADVCGGTLESELQLSQRPVVVQPAHGGDAVAGQAVELLECD
eukprot:CAMPEP_0116909514 /NCGR_PEP_ID=MMETSP0467-20121206/14323_1 /TAXON_ID=283647 /ORGANISM="Mesodinium pulex, Strain SPMC105" /LENGTH=125 /DNA_ID=CAMNT_0004584891 /DNA_START=247 /DNA_END=623 /DNA_ORIENTATION=-